LTDFSALFPDFLDFCDPLTDAFFDPFSLGGAPSLSGSLSKGVTISSPSYGPLSV